MLCPSLAISAPCLLANKLTSDKVVLLLFLFAQFGNQGTAGTVNVHQMRPLGLSFLFHFQLFRGS